MIKVGHRTAYVNIFFSKWKDNTLDLMEDFYDNEEFMGGASSVKDVGEMVKTELFWLAILVPALSTPSIIFLALNYSLFLNNNGFSETDAGLHTGFVFCVGVGAALFTGLSRKVRLLTKSLLYVMSWGLVFVGKFFFSEQIRLCVGMDADGCPRTYEVQGTRAWGDFTDFWRMPLGDWRDWKLGGWNYDRDYIFPKD